MRRIIMRKRSSVFAACILMLIMVFSMAACSGNSSTNSKKTDAAVKDAATTTPKEMKKIVLKLGHGTATDSLYHIGAQKFKEILEKKSNGQFDVQLFSDGKLGQDRDLIEGIKMGTIQMGMIGVEPLTNVAPKLKAANLPYIFKDRATAYKVLDGDIGKEMVADLPKLQGNRILGYFENGFRNVTNSKREIITPKDMSGLKIRTPQSPVSLSIFKALGANPTPMSFGELYTALEQGTVDGQENPLALIVSSKLYEVQKFVSLTNHIYSPMVLIISELTFSKLSPEQQKMIQESVDEAKKYERDFSAEQESKLVKELESKGVKVTKPDQTPFIEATKNVHVEFDKEYGSEFYERLISAAK